MTRPKTLLIVLAVYLWTLGIPAMGVQDSTSNRADERLTRQVRSQILTLPNYGVFDNISYNVNGNEVTLLGQVTRPALKLDAERVVKRIEGVEKVDNQIEVLPVSQNDNRLRRQLFQAIYRYTPLQRYGVGSNRPIRIVVKHGNVSLEGAVDSESDKNMVGLRAKGVHGVFSVANHLNVPKVAV